MNFPCFTLIFNAHLRNKSLHVLLSLEFGSAYIVVDNFQIGSLFTLIWNVKDGGVLLLCLS